ncbi:hypothetical protein ACHWQZ_G004892 [Mnemiopsis leidyi]
MDFFVTALNEMEENLNSVLHSILKETRVEDLNPTVLANKINKNPLAKMVVYLAVLMHNNISVCKFAAAKIDELKSQVLVDQKTVIECQQKQLESVKTEVDTVQQPKVVAVRRIGIQKPDANIARPINVTLTNPNEVRSVLSRSNLLKKSPEEYFRKLYLAPDRTLEERREHQKLVCEVKRQIESEPE